MRDRWRRRGRTFETAHGWWLFLAIAGGILAWAVIIGWLADVVLARLV